MTSECCHLIFLFQALFYKTSSTSLKFSTTAFVKTGVYAAEQIFANAEKSGAAKKDYVVAYLEKKGYKVNVHILADDLNNMIEAAVYQMNEEKKGE